MYQVLKRQKWLKPAEFANQMCRILTMCAIACLQSSSAPFPPSRFDAVSICPCSTDPTSNLYCVGDECLLCKMLRSPHAITDKNYAPMAAILLILSYHFFGRRSCCLKSGPKLCCGTSPWKTSRSLLVFYEAGLPSSVPNTPHSQQLRSQGLNIDPMSIAWVISNYYGPCPWLPPAKYRKNSPRLGAFQIVRWVREVA